MDYKTNKIIPDMKHRYEVSKISKILIGGRCYYLLPLFEWWFAEVL